MLFYIIVCLALAQLAHTCEPPDCDRPDLGTCGNACCNLDFYCNIAPEAMANRLAQVLNSTGPDQHYSFKGLEDLRKYNVSAQFILQGVHTTFVMKYNDTINLVTYANDGFFQTRLSAFSISQIAGALGDDGQNYKNLALLIKSGLPDLQCAEVTVFGCPKTN